MERKKFLSNLGLGVAAVCTGGALSSCGSGSKYDTPQPVVPPGTSLFSVDLKSELLNVGDSKVVGSVILARVAAGTTPNSFSAIAVACSHLLAKIKYDVTKNEYICPWHKSVFSTTGQVIQGPAVKAQQKYNVVITGTNLSVLS
jgi:cytochrome b6-f complex iron-sulfur subunit